MGGARSLGLADIPGFDEYLVEVFHVRSASKDESAVGFAGMAVACLRACLYRAVGLLVLGAADLALSSAATALAYMREHERELAGEASQFRAAGEKFAVKGGYRDTVLSGVASLLSAISFFKATKEFRELIKPRLTVSGFTDAPRRSSVTGKPKSDAPLWWRWGSPPAGRTRRGPRSKVTGPEVPRGTTDTPGTSDAVGSRGNATESSGKANVHEGAADTSGRPGPGAVGTSRRT